MQVDPTKPTLKPPGTKRLKLKCDALLSILLQFCFNFTAFKINLHHYTKEDMSQRGNGGFVSGTAATAPGPMGDLAGGRGLHSFTFQLNVSAFRGIWGAFWGCLGGV